MKRQIRIQKNLAVLSRNAAQEFKRSALRSVDDRGVFHVALSGGVTSLQLYHELGKLGSGEIPWENIHFFWGDERCVPHDDEESNYGAANDAFLTQVPIPDENVHPIEAVPKGSCHGAEEYEAILRDHFGSGAEGTFDLALLGMGEDGHTASLFPGDKALEEEEKWAVAVEAPDYRPSRDRITLTLPVLNRSREAMFLVSGESKRDAVAQSLRWNGPGSHRLPASLIRPRERLLWMLDEEAAPPRLNG